MKIRVQQQLDMKNSRHCMERKNFSEILSSKNIGIKEKDTNISKIFCHKSIFFMRKNFSEIFI